MSAAGSVGWKVAAAVFLVLTVGASGIAYYYYGQNQENIKRASGQDYYSQWQADETKISDLKTQIATDQQTIQYWKNQAGNGYNPSCAPNCDTIIANLNVQIASDNSQIASLNQQIANYQEILGLTKSFVITSSTTINEPACGGTGNPVCQGSSACTNNANCTPQYVIPSNFISSFCTANAPATCQGVHQGVLVLTWTSTVAMTVSFLSSFEGSTGVSSTSSSTASGDFAFPIYGTFYTTGFHNDSCSKDLAGNYHCDAVSLTYSETFDY
jgi:hypothetical protein